MTCYYPISGWESSTINPTGKRSIVFNPRDGLADRPIEVPCGKCTGCRADQSLMWSIRAYHENTLHDKSCFVTLTYDDEHMPADRLINKKDLQDFFKRLRKQGPSKLVERNGKQVRVSTIRYIACGEYGDTTRRPHYHAILFGEDFLYDKIDINDQLYSSNDLVSIWGKGHVSIAPVTMASICYVCGYVFKKISDSETFSLASRRPPIGHLWLSRFSDDLRRTGSVTIEGKEYPVPSRYLEWSPEQFESLKKERRKIARSGVAIVKRAALRNKEKNRKAKLNQKKEKL